MNYRPKIFCNYYDFSSSEMYMYTYIHVYTCRCTWHILCTLHVRTVRACCYACAASDFMNSLLYIIWNYQRCKTVYSETNKKSKLTFDKNNSSLHPHFCPCCSLVVGSSPTLCTCMYELRYVYYADEIYNFF